LSAFLTVQDLSICYESTAGKVTALDNVSLGIEENELLAVVGESGCGKSTLALALIGLLPIPPARILSGAIEFKGTDLVQLRPTQMREYRGTQIAMIFQEPLSSLNPVYKVGDQIAEAITIKRKREDGHTQVETDFMQKAHTVVPPRVSRLPQIGRAHV